jgi:hypothetical protein
MPVTTGRHIRNLLSQTPEPMPVLPLPTLLLKKGPLSWNKGKRGTLKNNGSVLIPVDRCTQRS